MQLYPKSTEQQSADLMDKVMTNRHEKPRKMMSAVQVYSRYENVIVPENFFEPSLKYENEINVSIESFIGQK